MSVAKAYAKALFETLHEQKAQVSAIDSLETQMNAFLETLESAKGHQGCPL